MNGTVRAVVLHEPGVIAVEQRPEPTLGPQDVAIAVRAIGICGSDMHLYHEGRIGDSVVRAPLVLGHESAGRVLAVGDDVQGLALGDRVIAEPGISCGNCRFCHLGRYNLCPNVRFLGIPPSDGLMAERVVVPARWVFKLPDGLSDTDGAMIEPFAVGLQATTEANIQPGDTVAVLGAGPIGLMVLQAARIRGAGAVYSIDLSENALKVAKALGAAEVINPRQEDAVARVMALTGGDGADHVIEAIGANVTIKPTLQLVRRGGIVTLVGIAADTAIPFNTTQIVRTGLQIRSSFRYAHQHPVALALAAAGRVDLRTLVTHRFPFAEAAEAFAYVSHNKDTVVKAVIDLA